MVVHAALLEAGAPHELRLVDFDSNEQSSADYIKLNPTGTVPALVIDDVLVQESAALIMLLAERHPEARLAPPLGSPRRAEWLKWTVHLSTRLGGLFRQWFYPGDLGMDDYTVAMRDAIRMQIEGTLKRIEDHLAQHGPYLLGVAFSSADLQLTMYMRWSRNMQRPATIWPHLNALAQRVTVRPAWMKMCEIEGLHDWTPAEAGKSDTNAD